MSLALPQAVVHHWAFSAFTESLKAEHGGHMVEWETQVWNWELNHTLPCPYDLPEQSKSSYHWNVIGFILKIIFQDRGHLS